MSGLLFALAVATAFAATSLLVYNLLPAGRGPAVRGLGLQAVDVERLPSVWFKWLYPVLNALAPLMASVPWPAFRARAPKELQRAGLGDVITPDHLLAFKVLAAIVTPLFASMILVIFQNPAMFVLAGIGGFFLPDRLVADLRRAREKQIVRALPGTVDVLSLSVEAGLEFLLALQRQIERGTPGPLRDELATVLNDIRLGKSRAEALKGLAARLEIPDVSSFVSVLVQADALGASIGPVLKSQAERMRVERFQRAEREGAKASQKILFPLVLFIFPAVLIVIVGPVILQFLYAR
jgi:tight adherence protein C